jgi:hypothetical protein
MDFHVRLLRRVARDARRRVRLNGPPGEHEEGSLKHARSTELARASAVAEARLASAHDRRRRASSAPPEAPPANVTPLAELEAVAAHASQRAALYRRRVLLGRGEPRRLAELERRASGAEARLRRARASDSATHDGSTS